MLVRNLSLRYNLDIGKTQTEFFVGFNNLFDTVAPPLPYAFVSQQPNTGALYDNVGRFIFGGVSVAL